jgi:hypothetical protein
MVPNVPDALRSRTITAERSESSTTRQTMRRDVCERNELDHVGLLNIHSRGDVALPSPQQAGMSIEMRSSVPTAREMCTSLSNPRGGGFAY